jgi:FAD synthetase
VESKKVQLTRVMVFGTFDMVHPGHLNFFKQARAAAKKSYPKTQPYLIVSLARDKNVKRIKNKKPKSSEKSRLAKIKSLPEVDRAVLGALGDHIPHIVKQKPNMIALGYDQTAYVRGLKTALKQAGLKVKIVRLNPHKAHIYKTSLLQK